MNIDEAIERVRPSTGENAFNYAIDDRWSRHELHALQEMKHFGILDPENILVETFNMDGEKQYSVWVWDYVLFAIRGIRRIEKDPTDKMSLRDAFRGLLQIRHYQGRLEQWHRSYTGNDAAHSIQQYLTDKIAPF